MPVATRPSELFRTLRSKVARTFGPVSTGIRKAIAPTAATAATASAGRGTRSRRCTAGVRQRPMKPPITPPAIAAIRPVIAPSGKREAGQGLTTQTCEKPHSAARPTVPIASSGERAEADRPLGGGRAPQIGEADALDEQRLDHVGREVGGDLAEQRSDQDRQGAANRDVDQQAPDCAARPDPDTRRDQADPGRQHDQRRLQGEGELGYPEVELALEGGERHQEGAGEDDLAESGPAGEGTPGRLALLVALGVQRPGAEHRERGAADQHQVGRSPEGHVLAEDPVPDVVEREGEQGAGAADRDHQGADRRVEAGRQPVGGAGRTVRQRQADHACEQDSEEPGEDEVVGRVGERARVASLVDVQGNVPVHAEDRDQQGDREEGAGQRRPAGQLGDALGDVGEATERREAAELVEQDGTEEQDRGHHRAGGGVDHVAGRRASRGRTARPEL